MFWKIYFWILSLLLGLGYAGLILQKGFGLIYVVDLIISLPSLLGFFLFAYKKTFLTTKFWQPYLIIYVLWDCFFNLILGPRIDHNFSRIGSLLGLLLLLPMWVALYLYAFKSLKKDAASD